MQPFEPTNLSAGRRVARVTQGLVLYFDTDWAEFWPAFVSTLGKLLQSPWAKALTHVRAWTEPSWNSWNLDRLESLQHSLLLTGPVGYSKLEFADSPALPQVGIDWQVIPPTQGEFARAGYLRVRLPFAAPVTELLQTLSLLVQELPVQQGRGGYLCHVDENRRAVGFDQAWVWARRYYGIDVLDTVEETWDAVDGLLGVNWLTVIGRRWLEDALKDVDFEDSSGQLRSTRTPHGGVVVQAGGNPILGDHNRFQDMSAYALISSWLRPALIDEPTGLPGMFHDRQSTKAWIHRFHAPDAWHEQK